MPDAFEVADLLVSHAVASHGDDIDLVAYYGSHAQGTARDDSDLDLFYVPREGTDPPVGKTFLLDGRLFDFWAIPWITLEGFATGRIRGWAFAPALVHHARPLHVRGEAQSARLARVKQSTLDLLKPEARAEMIRRALEAFHRVLADLGKLRLAASESDLPDTRCAGWSLIGSTIECLALANQTFFHRGLGAALGELDTLEHRPPDLVHLITIIATSEDSSRVADDGERLAVGTRRVLRRLKATLPSDGSMREPFRGAYPEIRDMVSKLQSACQSREPLAAGAAAWLLRSDLGQMLGADSSHGGFDLHADRFGELGFPDLLEASPGDPDDLADRARTLDRRLRRWLREQSVDLCEFETLDQLRDSL